MKGGGWAGVRCLAMLVAVGAAFAPDLNGQIISGQIVDAQNGAPVGLAAVFVLTADREPIMMRGADVDGRYVVELPGPDEYYLVVERLGYFENETPLLSVGSTGEYTVDMEMRPEPIHLDPLEVTVANERLEDFLTLEFGQHPASLSGYRNIQGIRLAEAKLGAKDNTDVLRRLYIPVSHGINGVCVGTFGAPPLPARSTSERINPANPATDPRDPSQQCGAIFVDGLRCRNDHLEEILIDRIGVVVAFSNSVHLYTRDFDWTFRPANGGGVC